MRKFGILKTPGSSLLGLREEIERLGHSAIEIEVREASPTSLTNLFKIFRPDLLISKNYHALVPTHSPLQPHHRELEDFFVSQKLPIAFLFDQGPVEILEDEFQTRRLSQRLYPYAHFFTQSASSLPDFSASAGLYRPGVGEPPPPHHKLSFQFASTLSYVGDAFCQPEHAVVGEPEMRVVHRDQYFAAVKGLIQKWKFTFSETDLLPPIIQFLNQRIETAADYMKQRTELERALKMPELIKIVPRTLGTLAACYDAIHVSSMLRKLAPDDVRVFGGPGWKQILGLAFESPIVPEENLPTLFYYSKLNLFPHRPSRSEVFDSNALLCMSAGNLALLPKAAPWIQVFDPQSPFFYESPFEVREKAEFWNTRDEDRIRLGKKQKQLVEKFFSWQPLIAELLKISP